ncbi:hydroxysqualene dehydroxylase HpnE [Extensimonas sp. H3M7-6]|uniref:hydroxysqualene dehydroxylase HpnE n=1 Tax=Extensimonas soli TaxID=3031322 RepID=UPI0023DC1E2B|nr:hydroxysqualene dehydroxylase HpnE [Extensimonas sp. H3M7-6]MDF1481693.1 hydroxysqualene dehydroxylase HpnE [Extensimonas sp. H3M7-6]
MAKPVRRKIAIVGAGWAGMAAALAVAQAGHEAIVLEAAQAIGGRARSLFDPKNPGWPLDNGQHILIGAYGECLRLMRLVGVAPESALLRLPLALRFADGSGLQLPDLPPPWDALAGIATARGWRWRDKWALLRLAAAWQRRGFACAPHATVAQLCAGLPQQLREDFIAPLCVSALNTPVHEASGAVFLRVLHDSLLGGRGGSHLLLPRTDLGSLFPEPAARWLRAHGGALHTGRRVQRLVREDASGMGASVAAGWLLDGERFDAVVLATSAGAAARLVHACADTAPAAERPALHAWAACAQALRHTAIATVYAQCTAPDGKFVSTASARTTGRGVLPQPLLALRSSAAQPAQFVFDRGALGGPPGLLAFVVSAADTSDTTRVEMERQVLAQAQAQLAHLLPGPLHAVQTVVEKRATFACTPALQRPPACVLPGLWACGDYVAGPYPATLEGAVRSGTAAGRQAVACLHGVSAETTTE